jgi:hypothetical protein
MDHTGQRILVIHEITDPRTRYLTAKKLAQLYPEGSFGDWKTKLDTGGHTVVMRSDDPSDFDPYRRSIEMLGAETEVLEQKVIGGAKVF